MLAIGLMSGTSLDGVDAALLETDGIAIGQRLGFCCLPYAPGFKAKIRAALGETKASAVADLAQELTDFHAKAVDALLQKTQCPASEVGVIGFHGQTLSHDPTRGHTLQIGDGARLAQLTGIKVVDQLRIQDVKAGGQGAPLVPVYHQAIVCGFAEPVAILNLGGVGNVTLLPDMVAFDTGPGNALLDDWALKHTGIPVDMDGRLAAQGRVHFAIVDAFAQHPYFRKAPPKSLDRDDFNLFAKNLILTLSPADGAATLAAFTARAVALALAGTGVRRIFVCGGGRLNPVIMALIATETGITPQKIEVLGLDGDAIEAEAFAFLAVRSLQNLPITFPGTTGVPVPMSGGTLHGV